MNKCPVVFLFIFWMSITAFGQVGINNDGSTPDPSAGLEVKFSDKGFLPPRLTFEQRNAIANPAEGLMVYCSDCNTDGSGIISTFQGGKWRNISWNCPAPVEPQPGVPVPGGHEVVWNWGSVPISLGYKWNTTSDFASAEDLGKTTTRVETGLDCSTAYTRYVWAYNECGQSAPVTLSATTARLPFGSVPAPGTHVASSNGITWNWSPVAGASGYKLGTGDDYGTAIDLGPVTSHTETGLDCNTLYSRFLWAYDACGNSSPVALTGTTLVQPPAPEEGTSAAAPDLVTWAWNPVEGASGYRWSDQNNFDLAQDMGVSLSYTETALNCNTSYTRYLWAYNGCGFSPVKTLSVTTTVNPPNPVEGNHIAASTQITWNWDPAAGATGYRWNSVNDYASATDLGLLTSYSEAGLTTGITYTRFVWAYGSCGVSASTVLTKMAWTCGDPYTVHHVAGVVAPEDKTVAYGTATNIPGEPGKCWITSNLGADRQALSVDDVSDASAGWYWQFNRRQGFVYNTSSITPDWSLSVISELSDWTAANDPCAIEMGAGWHIPSLTEWANLDDAGGWSNWNGPWNSALKLHAAGYLNGNNASLTGRGATGYYWSGTQEGSTVGWLLYFNNSNSVMGNGGKIDGYSVRCLGE